MSAELLGIIDSLEATILEASKMPFSNKIVIDEKDLLILIDKIRISLKSQRHSIREEVEVSSFSSLKPQSAEPVAQQDAISENMMKQRQLEYETVKHDAREYADNVLAGLHSVVAKMQYNLTRLDASLQQSRETIIESDDKLN